MFCRFDGFYHDCESELCANCSVFEQWEDSMRNVREVKWFDPREVLPSERGSCVLGIVSGDQKGIHLRKAYELVICDRNGEWYSDGYPEMENLEVHFWCELPDLPEEMLEEVN